MEEYDYGFSLLPEGCLSEMISRTSVKDACRSSAVSRGFKSASESDAVWERFLPLDYQEIISKSDPPVDFSTKKELFFRLCDSSILINDAKLSFRLSKTSGKKCFMLPARELSMAWKDTPLHWIFKSSPESRFSEVAELLNVCWLEIQGRMETKFLSPKTTYAAYLVYKVTDGSYGLEVTSKSRVNFFGDNVNVDECDRILLSRAEYRHEHRIGRMMEIEEQHASDRFPCTRIDGWMEMYMGEFYNDEGEGEIEMQISETKYLNWKKGLILEGIEVRPKEDGLDST